MSHFTRIENEIKVIEDNLDSEEITSYEKSRIMDALQTIHANADELQDKLNKEIALKKEAWKILDAWGVEAKDYGDVVKIQGNDDIFYAAKNLLDQQIMEILDICLKSGRFHYILDKLQCFAEELGTDKLIPA